MLVAESRPRNLKWYHSGALLFGDWGTSRLYVLGLTFFIVGHASPLFMVATGVLMLAVAWGYTVVCRSFPAGGGVYNAARQINTTLSVIGATLLLCTYIMTAAISVVVALHYMAVPREWTLGLAFFLLAALGVVNWFGARSAGRLAVIIAVVAGVVSLIIAIACLPFVPAGLRTFRLDTLPTGVDAWIAFTKICLAMAGIEAVANMTGLMRQPVVKTASRTIWPVALEVTCFNLLFVVALAGLPALMHITTPDSVSIPDGVVPPDDVLAYRDTAMKLIAVEGGRYWLGMDSGLVAGRFAAFVFGLLLLSAANTAIMTTVSVFYAMGQDRELPRAFARLNYSGVPSWALVAACILPAAVLLYTQDVEILAELYVIGVTSAISTTILSCAMNRRLPMHRVERSGLWALGLFLLAVTLTIMVTRERALIFASGLVVAVLITRTLLRMRKPLPEGLPAPALGWLAEIKAAPAVLDPSRPRVMLAARGRYQSEFAVDLAKRRNAALFAIYVRTLRLIDVVPGKVPQVEEDPTAQEALGTTAVLARQAGVPFVPIYITSTDIADEVLDYTVTYGCDTLILGKSRRSLFSRRLAGDVVAKVAELLPDNVQLILRAGDAPYVPGRPDDVEHVQRRKPEPDEDEGEVPPT